MIYHTHHNTDGEFNGTFHDLAATVDDAVTTLRPWADRFDAIIATGISGLVVAAPLALALNIPLTVLRKYTENCHSGQLIEGVKSLTNARVLWVDDFTSNGETRERVEQAVAGASVWSWDADTPCNATLTGMYLYRDDELTLI